MTFFLQGRANQLYHAGFRRLRDIADADIQTLVSSIEHLSRRQAAQIIASAKVKMAFQIFSLSDDNCAFFQMLRNEKLEIVLEQAKEIIADPSDPNADDAALDFIQRMSQ